MSFNEFESSFFNATPERLFLFEMAATRWAYVASTEEVVRLGVTYSPMPIEMEELTQSLTEDAQIILAKHRNGPTGAFHVRFRQKISRFEDLLVQPEDFSEPPPEADGTWDEA